MTFDKLTVVLKRTGFTQEGRRMMFSHEPLTAHGHVVHLDAQTWRDMGEPDEITVQVKPGDRTRVPVSAEEHPQVRHELAEVEIP